jgi:CNT family concentrative nucleoside transporter
MDVHNLVSFGGIFVILGLAWALSENRRVFNWRVVLGGLIFLLAFGAFLFISPAGVRVFEWVDHAVTKVLESANAGTEFVFGRLALPPGVTSKTTGETSLGFFLAFQAFPTIIFFSALMAVLYYGGVMQFVIRLFSFIFAKLMRLSGAESLCAASDIFVGIEASLTVRPHLSQMTRSELCTILTTGMASISSNVLAFYVYCLQGQFPGIAGHLVSASVLAIPSAIVVSKLLLPETERPKTMGLRVETEYAREESLFEAILNGSLAGVKLIVGIVALLLAVVGLVALLNLTLNGIGASLGCGEQFSLQAALGWVFQPLAVVMGVPAADASAVGNLLGERLVLTEVASYRHLAELLKDGALTHPRSAVIAAYALCGFAHLPSLAIFVGGIAALAPDRKSTLARLGPRALLGATLACLLTGCIAGTCFTSGALVLTGK